MIGMVGWMDLIVEDWIMCSTYGRLGWQRQDVPYKSLFCVQLISKGPESDSIWSNGTEWYGTVST